MRFCPKPPSYQHHPPRRIVRIALCVSQIGNQRYLLVSQILQTVHFDSFSLAQRIPPMLHGCVFAHLRNRSKLISHPFKTDHRSRPNPALVDQSTRFAGCDRP